MESMIIVLIVILWHLSIISIMVVGLSSMLIRGVSFIIDMLSHFQLQYLVATFVLLLFGLHMDLATPHFTIVVFGYLLLQLIILIPFKLSPASDEFIKNSDIFYINANYQNEDYEDIVKTIKENDLKTVAVVEAHNRLLGALKELYGEPICIKGERGNKNAIFSKRKYRTVDVELEERTYPICITKIDDRVLVLIHPYPPMDNDRYKRITDHFKEVREVLNELDKCDEKYILIGDFNSTIFSPIFRRNFKKIFRSNVYSWAVDTVLALPIDHALSNGHIEVERSKKMSSDHAGLFIKYSSKQ